MERARRSFCCKNHFPSREGEEECSEVANVFRRPLFVVMSKLGRSRFRLLGIENQLLFRILALESCKRIDYLLLLIDSIPNQF